MKNLNTLFETYRMLLSWNPRKYNEEALTKNCDANIDYLIQTIPSEILGLKRLSNKEKHVYYVFSLW